MPLEIGAAALLPNAEGAPPMASCDATTTMALCPLITICGTTGVGKSKLAIELAQALAKGAQGASHGYTGARIINADSMQVYAGMDVITNKVPVAERGGIEHLLMGFKQPGEQYIVSQWVGDALRLVSPLANIFT